MHLGYTTAFKGVSDEFIDTSKMLRHMHHDGEAYVQRACLGHIDPNTLYG